MVTWKSIYARSQADAAHLAHLVDHVEDTRFDEILLGILQDKGPAAEVNGFLYASSNRDPRPVAWCGRPRGTAERVDRYARRYHQHHHHEDRPKEEGVDEPAVEFRRRNDLPEEERAEASQETRHRRHDQGRNEFVDVVADLVEHGRVKPGEPQHTIDNQVGIHDASRAQAAQEPRRWTRRKRTAS